MAIKEKVIASAVELTPPASVSAATVVFGVTRSDWVLISTLIYTLLLIARLLWRWVILPAECVVEENSLTQIYSALKTKYPEALYF